MSPCVCHWLSVESGGWLIEDDDLEMMNEAGHEFEAAFHPAGIGAGLLIGVICKVDECQYFGNAIRHFARGDSIESSEQFERYAPGEPIVHAGFLWNITDPVSDVSGSFLHVDARDSCRPGSQCGDGCEDFDQH